jgi:hypothetical protein
LSNNNPCHSQAQAEAEAARLAALAAANLLDRFSLMITNLKKKKTAIRNGFIH